MTVRIKESVPSGVVAFLEGIRAFIPHPSCPQIMWKTDDTDRKKMCVAVITVRSLRRINWRLSGKVVTRQEREGRKKITDCHKVPGSVVEGTVESIMPYGAFINIGNGISGLVHISQISQKWISSVREV